MSDAPKEFEIALALAGAATAGAYEAGVVDFLLEALAQWESARAAAPDSTPAWRVRLRAAVGTSAGALTTALLAASLNLNTEHVKSTYKPEDSPDPKNLLFDGWVSKFEYSRMFETDDVDPPSTSTGESKIVRSIAHARCMQDYARSVLNNPAYNSNLPVPYWARDFQAFCVNTNLRGVEYDADGIYSNIKNSTCRALDHIDVIGFHVTTSSSSSPIPHAVSAPANLQLINLNAARDSDQVFSNLREAAVASAAVPVVFSCSSISRPLTVVGNPLIRTKPSWPTGMEETYEYDAVDGGVFANHPVALAEHALTSDKSDGNKSVSLSSKFSSADASVILISPFPVNEQRITPNYKSGNLSIINTLGSLVQTMMDQGTFELDEINRALNDDVASTFMVAPMRDTTPGGYTLATSSLGAFAGVLHRKLRVHDFLLGRRNCQQFLRNVFVISKEDALVNPIFGPTALPFANADGKISIIPLIGTANDTVPEPDWPKFSASELSVLETDVIARLKVRSRAVLKALAYSHNLYGTHWFSSLWNGTIDRLITLISDKIAYAATPVLKKGLAAFNR